MKRFFLFIFYIIIHTQTINSQKKFGKVNLELLIKEHTLNSYYDSIYNSEKLILHKSLSLKDSLINIEIRNSISYDYTEKGRKESLKKMNRLIEKRESYAESINLQLNKLNNKHKLLIKNKVLIEIKKYAVMNNFEFIVDGKLILFDKEKSIKDLTDRIRVKMK